MAKPRIFVSSTYYDLKHIRSSLEAFINSFGYEPVLYESGDILFSPNKPLDNSCYSEIENCHMQILIVGGYYGSPASSELLTQEQRSDQFFKYNSITKAEFETALAKKIPIYFFVESGVLSEYNTYKKNRDNHDIIYAHVDSVNIFHLLDDIFALKEGNFVQGFTKFSDISDWLKLQWAHLMAEFISNHSKQIELKTLNYSLESLKEITNSLKEYTEVILTKVEPNKAKNIIQQQNMKYLETRENIFKNSALFSFIKSYHRSTSDNEYYQLFRKSKTVEEFLSDALPNIDLNSVLQYNKTMLTKSYTEVKEEM